MDDKKRKKEKKYIIINTAAELHGLLTALFRSTMRRLTGWFCFIVWPGWLVLQNESEYLQYYLLHYAHVFGFGRYKLQDLYVSVISKNVLLYTTHTTIISLS